MTSRLQNRRDTAANWTSNNPTLAAGEIGLEVDTSKFKMGDGSTAWTSLAYAYTAGATGPTGATGPQGVTGNTGATGPVGPASDAPYVIYLDGGNVTPNTDIIYNAETSSTTSWTYTIDAGASTTTF